VSTKIGALWKHKYTDKDTGKEKTFYSGEIEWPGVKGRIIIRQNDKKGNEKAPELILIYETLEPRTDGQKQAEESQASSDDTDDIPF